MTENLKNSPRLSSDPCALGMIVLAPLFFGALAALLGQDVGWDMRNYHLYNGWALATGRYAQGLDLLPSQMQFFFNPLLHALQYLVASHVSPLCAGIVMGMVQGVNCALLFFLSRHLLPGEAGRKKDLICIAIAVAGATGAMGLAETGTTMGDNVTGMGILLSLLLTLRAGAQAAWRPFLWAAIPAGMAVGLKLTAGPFALALLAALPFMTHSPRALAAFAAGLAGGFLLTYGYWALYLYAHFESPLFPYFNNIFQSPMLPAQPILDKRYLQWESRSLLFPFLFLKNPLLVGESAWRDLRIPLLYVAGPAAALAHAAARKWRGAAPMPRETAYLLCLAAVAYTAWVTLFSIYRYLLPLEMLAPLMLVLCCRIAPAGERTRNAGAAVLLALAALFVVPGDWGRQPWQPATAQAATEKATEKALDKAEGAMVLMAGRSPYAHLLPLFPDSARFVRLENFFFKPTARPLFANVNRLIGAAINAHNGHFLFFVPESYSQRRSARTLAFFGLKRTGDACTTIADPLHGAESRMEWGNDTEFPARYRLCAVTQLKAGKRELR